MTATGMKPDMGQMHSCFADMRPHEALLCSGAVRRYHTHPFQIGHQTVAEHTFRAMALMLSLWPNHTHTALKALLVHDGAEGAVGDVPSPTKWLYPQLGEALNAVEEHVLFATGLEYHLTEEETRWVKICDWLEGAFYALDQIRLGNSGMIGVHNAFVSGLRTLEPLPIEVIFAHEEYRQQVVTILPTDSIRNHTAPQQNHTV